MHKEPTLIWTQRGSCTNGKKNRSRAAGGLGSTVLPRGPGCSSDKTREPLKHPSLPIFRNLSVSKTILPSSKLPLHYELNSAQSTTLPVESLQSRFEVCWVGLGPAWERTSLYSQHRCLWPLLSVTSSERPRLTGLLWADLCPPKICSSPNPQDLGMRPYLETGPLAVSLVEMRLHWSRVGPE